MSEEEQCKKGNPACPFEATIIELKVDMNWVKKLLYFTLGTLFSIVALLLSILKLVMG